MSAIYEVHASSRISTAVSIGDNNLQSFLLVELFSLAFLGTFIPQMQQLHAVLPSGYVAEALGAALVHVSLAIVYLFLCYVAMATSYLSRPEMFRHR